MLNTLSLGGGEAESYQFSLNEDAVDAVLSIAEELRVADFVLREGMKADYQMHDRKCVFKFKEVCAPLVDMRLIVTPTETQWITDMDSITYEVDSNVDWIIE